MRIIDPTKNPFCGVQNSDNSQHFCTGFAPFEFHLNWNTFCAQFRFIFISFYFFVESVHGGFLLNARGQYWSKLMLFKSGKYERFNSFTLFDLLLFCLVGVNYHLKEETVSVHRTEQKQIYFVAQQHKQSVKQTQRKLSVYSTQ